MPGSPGHRSGIECSVQGHGQVQAPLRALGSASGSFQLSLIIKLKPPKPSWMLELLITVISSPPCIQSLSLLPVPTRAIIGTFLPAEHW